MAFFYGIADSFGELFVHIREKYQDDPNVAFKVSLVGSLSIGTMFLLSPVAAVLTDWYGMRRIAIIGSIIATLGMFLSSLSVDHSLGMLMLTYGIMFGGGTSFAMQPSLAILVHYFKNRLGVANGLVACGAPLFTMVGPFLLKYLVTTYEVKTCFQVLTGITSITILCVLSFKSQMPAKNVDILNMDNWKNKRYIIWVISTMFMFLGYYTPYIHVVQFVKDKMPGHDGAILLSLIPVTSCIFRFLSGKIVDYPCVNKILFQQVALFFSGVIPMLMLVTPEISGFEFNSLIILALVLGCFDGIFVSLWGPIANEICGARGTSQAIGFLLGVCSIPLTFGPTLSGYLYDVKEDYVIAFVIGGVFPILGSLLMTVNHFLKPKDIKIGNNNTAYCNTEELS